MAKLPHTCAAMRVFYAFWQVAELAAGYRYTTSCLSLLSNAALVWNTMHMTRIIAQLRAAGETITDADLARVSPMAFTHIIPNGTYFTRPMPRDHAGERNGHRTPLGVEVGSDV